MQAPSIFNYIKTEESRFETDEVRVGENWNWNFRSHVQMIFHLVNGVFFTGENNWLRAFKNIMEPILNLCAWMEDIEIKDVLLYVEGEKSRALSFLIKKYHDEIYVKEHDLDLMIDEIAESDLTYGGVLVQKSNGKRPEVLDLRTIAFCDQTHTLGGPIAFKHFFSPGKLREMSKLGWGKPENGATISIEELITLAEFEKEPAGMNDAKKNKVPGKTIEAYVIRGQMPAHYLNDDDNMEEYVPQLQVVAFYTDKESRKQEVILYRKKEVETNLKFFTSKEIYGRALGRGVGEGLLHPQVWTNFLTIHKMNMLKAASKSPLWTDDEAFANRQDIGDQENLQLNVVAEGKKIGLIPTVNPASVQLFERTISELYEQAQLTGDAFGPLQGKQSVSGTTFRGQERLVAQGRGNHDRRRGKRAKFIEEIYRDWIIPDIVKEIVGGVKFWATLSPEEMKWVLERLTENYADRQILEDVLEGKLPGDRETLKAEFAEKFSAQGNRFLFEILAEEFRGIEIRMGINVAGKQKDVPALSDKVLSIIQVAMANPQGFAQAMQNPALARSFNDILEFSGLSQANFSELTTMPTPMEPLETEALEQMKQPA